MSITGIDASVVGDHEEWKRLGLQGWRMEAWRVVKPGFIGIEKTPHGIFSGLGRILDHYRELREKGLWPEDSEVLAVRVSDGLIMDLDTNDDWVLYSDPREQTPKEPEPTTEFLQIEATFALLRVTPFEAAARYGWHGGHDPEATTDPDLKFVSYRDIGWNRELVLYQVEPVPGENQVHFEVYDTTGNGMKIPETDTNFDVTVVMMSCPSIHGWG